MKTKTITSIILIFLTISTSFSQGIQVETILDLDASGGVTFGPDGNVYVSDFGSGLSTGSTNTKVYRIKYGTWEVNEFATGFLGASGARFDSEGNFYQSNPSGGRVSKVNLDGTVEYNWVTGLNTPIGITNDSLDNLYVCNCGSNSISKITPEGIVTTFSSGPSFVCPNGITIDPDENLYVCNFNDGRIIKITPDGTPSTFTTLPIYSGIGNGHLTYKNGFLFVATIGVGLIYKVSLTGETEVIAGQSLGFSNEDGSAFEATFSKPNGIAASVTGDTLWVNCSVPSWTVSTNDLHPGLVRMITGVCSLPDVECDLSTTDITEIEQPNGNRHTRLFPPFPNPAVSEVEINFEINNSPQKTQLKLTDYTGKTILIIDEGTKGKGIYQNKLNTGNLAAGLYFLILKSDNYTLTEKLIVK